MAKNLDKSEIEALRGKLKQLAIANRQYQAKHTQQRREKGQVRISLWVPEEHAEELRQIAKAMCIEKEKKPRKKSSEWSYVRLDPKAVWKRTILKIHGAQWQNKTKKHANTWRVRTEILRELKLDLKVVAQEKTAKRVAKHPSGTATRKPISRTGKASTSSRKKTTKKTKKRTGKRAK